MTNNTVFLLILFFLNTWKNRYFYSCCWSYFCFHRIYSLSVYKFTMHFIKNINHKKKVSLFFCLSRLINKKKLIKANDRNMKKKNICELNSWIWQRLINVYEFVGYLKLTTLNFDYLNLRLKFCWIYIVIVAKNSLFFSH